MVRGAFLEGVTASPYWHPCCISCDGFVHEILAPAENLPRGRSEKIGREKSIWHQGSRPGTTKPADSNGIGCDLRFLAETTLRILAEEDKLAALANNASNAGPGTLGGTD